MGLLGLLLGIGVIVFGVAQFVAGYAGIALHLGTWWAFGAVFVALLLRFTLPVTIGAFFGARDVWGWDWPWALLFAAPGLALAVPGMLAALIKFGASLFSRDR